MDAIHERTDFRSADRASIMAQGKAEIRKWSQEAYGKSMETFLATLPTGKSRTIRRGMETGAWLSVLPSTVSGPELLAQDFRDALSMCYREAPPGLPACCDGRDAPFTLQHALACKKGGLVMHLPPQRDSRRTGKSGCAGKTFTPSEP